MQDIIHVTAIDREGQEHLLEAPTDMNMNIMELCKSYELPVLGTCGGMALCSTCHIYVLSNHALPNMNTDEENILDQAFFVNEQSRLGCQIQLHESMDGLVFKLAPEAEE